ncbi:MAG: hypothetical protein ACRD2Q_10935 [Terriglobales bacterium]
MRPTKFAILMSLLLGISGAGKSTASSEEVWWRNSLSCPLRFSGPPNGAYALENRSEARIVQYRLGCVTQEGGVVKVKKRFPATQMSLDPGQAKMKHSTSGYLEEQALCWKPKLKVAIVEALFEDQGVWRLP